MDSSTRISHSKNQIQHKHQGRVVKTISLCRASIRRSLCSEASTLSVRGKFAFCGVGFGSYITKSLATFSNKCGIFRPCIEKLLFSLSSYSFYAESDSVNN